MTYLLNKEPKFKSNRPGYLTHLISKEPMPRQSNPFVVKSSDSAKVKALKRTVQAAERGVAPRGIMSAVGVKKPYTYKNPGPFGKFGRMVGAGTGRYFAGEVGSNLGEKLGGYLHYIGKIFGSGDYITSPSPVKVNSLINGSQVPSFGSESVRLRHREFLGDIISSATPGAFQIQNYSINPGLAASFPWLAKVVGSTFQQYRINGLVYEFRSMSADALNSTNTALGSVVMSADYDSKDSPFSTKQQMENTMGGVSCKPSSCMLHGIECARNQTSVSELYVRAKAVPSGSDVRLYDMANFYVATVGCQGANVNLGELWVSYDITFFKPIEQPPGFLNLYTDYNLSGASALQPLLLDTSRHAIQPAYDSIGVVSITGTTIVLPLSLPTNSVYMLIFVLRNQAATASLVHPTITYSGGLVGTVSFSGVPFFNGQSTGFVAPTNTTASTTLCSCTTFGYDGTGTLGVPPTITFGTNGTFPTAPSGGNLIIMQLPTSRPI